MFEMCNQRNILKSNVRRNIHIMENTCEVNNDLELKTLLKNHRFCNPIRLFGFIIINIKRPYAQFPNYKL